MQIDEQFYMTPAPAKDTNQSKLKMILKLRSTKVSHPKTSEYEDSLEFVNQPKSKSLKKNLASHTKLLTNKKNKKLLSSYNMVGLVVKDVLN